MKRSISLRRILLAGVVAAVAALPLAQLAYAGPDAPDVPSKIAVEEGHKVFLVGHAVGVQIYKCNVTAGAYRWGFVAPRADLYGDNGQLIMTHFAGPKWQAKDGSEVLGTRVDGVDSPGTIQWLLLSASSSPGPDGDRLAGTTFIQRLATTGGVMPTAASCNEDTVGTIEEVPYTADYYFWKAIGD
jgi:hypothetical protein